MYMEIYNRGYTYDTSLEASITKARFTQAFPSVPASLPKPTTTASKDPSFNLLLLPQLDAQLLHQLLPELLM